MRCLHIRRLTSPFSLLLLSRIVSWIDIRHPPRPHRVDLHDGLPLAPREVVGSRRHHAIAAGRQRGSRSRVELVSHTHVEGAGDYGDVLVHRVEVRLDLVAVRHLEPVGEEALRLDVSLDHSELGALGESWWTGTPLDPVLGEHRAASRFVLRWILSHQEGSRREQYGACDDCFHELPPE